jgi:Uma2 family endonuclease
MMKMSMEPSGALPTAKGRTSFPRSGNYETINGIPHAVPVPDTRHRRIAVKLTAYLYRNLEQKNLGFVFGAPCRVMLSSWNVVQPDVFFLRKNREGIVGDRMILGPPDLMVEIVSDDTRTRDLKEKRKIYADAGIQEFWAVDPRSGTIEQQVWSELGYISVGFYGKRKILSSAFFPDLKLPVSKVFA